MTRPGNQETRLQRALDARYRRALEHARRVYDLEGHGETEHVTVFVRLPAGPDGPAPARILNAAGVCVATMDPVTRARSFPAQGVAA